MFAYVKSFFIANPPSETKLAEAEHDSVSGEKQESTSENIPIPAALPKCGQKTAAQSYDEGDDEPPPVVSPTSAAPLICALFSVDGVDFQCLASACSIDLEEGYIIIRPEVAKEVTAGKPAPGSLVEWNVRQLLYVRQHQDCSFQLMVGKERERASEYGFMFATAEAAKRFRQLLWPALLDTAVCEASIRCAIAVYDHLVSKEFTVLSINAVGTLSLRRDDDECFFSFSTPDGGSDIYVCGNIGMDMQPTISPAENKISFIAVPFGALGNQSSLYLVEFLPSREGEAEVRHFFETFTELLRARVQSADGDNTRMDEDFELGDVGDESVQHTWRQGCRDMEIMESDAGSDDDEIVETGGGPVRYKSGAGRDRLLHRFMDVGKERTFVCRADDGGGEENSDEDDGVDSGNSISARRATNAYRRTLLGRSGKPTPKLKLSVYKRAEGPEGGEVLTSAGIITGDKFLYKGRHFNPSQGMLHQQEQKLIISAPDDTDKGLYLMDLNTEQVVQRFDMHGHSANSIFAATKFGGGSGNPTFYANDPRSVALLDTRTNNRALAFDYKTNPLLTTGVTDGKGHLALASRLGELRLFDGQINTKGDGLKRAKTLISTVKEPITAIDVTKDGSWVVATTRSFLIVICTKLRETGLTGFETALGQHKPAPRYLMLSAEDIVKYEITDINFAPARFDQDEECIVTSTDNMAVVWDFGTVKRGKPFYSVRFAPDVIRDVQVSMEDTSNVIVAYPSAVGLLGTEKRTRVPL